MRGSFKKLRKIYAQNITVNVSISCLCGFKRIPQKINQFFGILFGTTCKVQYGYIQINIILKGQEYIGFSFLRKYIFHSPENIFLQKEKFTYISIHRDSMLRYGKIKFIKGILNCFP